MKRSTAAVIALHPLLFPPSVSAQGLPHPRCMRDAEGELYCARWDLGVAVRNGEGDIAFAPVLARLMQEEDFDWSRFPNLDGWFGRISARPSWPSTGDWSRSKSDLSREREDPVARSAGLCLRLPMQGFLEV